MRSIPDIQRRSRPSTMHGNLDDDGAPRAAFWRWLQTDFPWLASPLRLLAAMLLMLALGLGVQQLVLRLSRPPAPVVHVAQQQLRHMLDQVEECRGTESLLVMLPTGGEREAAVSKLQRHQRQIDNWLRDNSAWLAASQGQATVVELHEAATAWRALQQRITQAEVVLGRTGLVKESRVLMTGPSADAYRRLVTTLERLVNRDMR